MPKFSVIIAAAGRAERFGGGEKKTFAKLDGRPIFLRSVEHFINRQDVCQTILAVAPEDARMVKSSYGANLAFMGVKLVEGGAQRSETVAAALKVVSDEAEYVAVHDAARPCVTVGMIDAVFAEAPKTGAAILAAPIAGTVKRAGDSKVIEETVLRTGLYEAQTPQAFRKDILLDAYARLGRKTGEAQSRSSTRTGERESAAAEGGDQARYPFDDAQVVELLGYPVAIVISDATNLKITTRADMTLANAILKARPARPAPRMGAYEEAQW